MKKRVFSILGAAAAAFLLFAGCQTDVDSGNGKSNAAKIEDAVKELEKKFTAPLNDGYTLPTKSGEVDIEWQSDDEYIDNGKVKAPITNDTEKVKTPKDVTFEATLTCGGETKKQTFPVKVQYRVLTQGEQNAAKALNEAISELKNKVKTRLLPNDGTINLPKKAGEYDVTWTAKPEGIINTDTGAVTHKEGTGSDKVKLTATLKKGDKTETTTDIDITVDQKDAPVNDQTLVDAAMANVNLPAELPDGKTLALPTTLENDVTVEWTSENTDVISKDGKVTRPDALDPVSVTLKATLMKGEAKTEKTFTVKVHPTDATIVKKVKEMLTLGNPVISDEQETLTLPQAKNGVAITWKSGSGAAVIEGNEKAKRGTVKGASEQVTLTATLMKGAASDTKDFTVTVFAKNEKPTDRPDAEILNDAEKQLKAPIKAEVSSPTDKELSLPKSVGEGKNKVSVEWTSNNNAISVKGEKGIINYPTTAQGQGPTAVTLTAKMKTKKGVERAFTITVQVRHTKAEQTPQDPNKDVEAALAKLKGEIPSSQTITEDNKTFNLKTDIDGVSVSWKSSDKTIINPETGKVTRPDGADDKTVTLTATLSKKDATPKTYTVTVTVKGKSAKITDQDTVNAAASKLTLPTESKNGQAITLPKPDPADGVAVTWKSRNTNVIKDDGTVEPPPAPKPVDVKLTATLIKGDGKTTVERTVKVFPTDAAMAQWAAKQYSIPKTAKHGDTISLPVTEIQLEGRADKGSVHWTADPTGIINTGSGAVAAPSKLNGAGPTKVTLIAECKVGEQKATHDYEVSVEHREPTAQELVEEAHRKFDLKADKDVRSPKAKLDLKDKTDGDVSITWEADPAGIIGVDKIDLGKIKYPQSGKAGETKVTLKATFSKKGATTPSFKTFEITVHHVIDESKALAEVKEKLTLAKTLDKDEDLELPKPDPAYGVTVEWSSDSDVIKINGDKGAVKRPYGIGSETVTLTATLKKGSQPAQIKTFPITVTYRNDGAWKAFKEAAVSAVKLELSKTGEGGIDKEKVVADVTGVTAKDWEAGINHPYSFSDAGIYLVRFTVTAPAANTDMRFNVHMEDGSKRDLATVPFKANTAATAQSYLVYVDDDAKGKNASLSLSLKKGKTTVEKVAVEHKSKWGTDHDDIKAWNFWKSQAANSAAVAASGVTQTGITLHEWVGEGKTVGGADVGVEYATKATAAGKQYVQFKVGADIETVKLLGKSGKSLAICDLEDANANTLYYFEVDVKDEDKDDLKIQFLPKSVTGGANGTEKNISIANVALKDAAPSGATEAKLRSDPVAKGNWTVLTGGYDVPNKDVYKISSESGNNITLELKKAAMESGEPYIKLTYKAAGLTSGKKYNVTYDITGMNKPYTELRDKNDTVCSAGAKGNLAAVECKESGDGYVALYPKTVGTYTIKNMKVEQVQNEGLLDKGGIIGDFEGGSWETGNAQVLEKGGDSVTYTYTFTAPADKHKVFWKILVDKSKTNDVFGGDTDGQHGNNLEVNATEVELKRCNHTGGKSCETDVEPTAKYTITLKVTPNAGGTAITKLTAKVVKTSEPTLLILHPDAYVKTAIKRFKGEWNDSGNQKNDLRKLSNPTVEGNARLYKVTFIADKSKHNFEIINRSDTDKWAGGTVNAGSDFADLSMSGSTGAEISGLHVGGHYELTVKAAMNGSSKKLSVKVKEISDTYATIKFEAINIPDNVGEVYLCTQRWVEGLTGENVGNQVPYPIKSWNYGGAGDGYDTVKKNCSKHFATVTNKKASFPELTYVAYDLSKPIDFKFLHVVGCKQGSGDGEHDQLDASINGEKKVPATGNPEKGKTYTVIMDCSAKTMTITKD